MGEALFFEDFRPGRSFRTGTREVTARDIKAFAAEFDPQPFHLDESAARETIFGGLVASGWHTAAVTMRLLADGFPVAGGIAGVGLDELRWPAPVRPGDVLHAEIEVLEVRASRSRPNAGLVKLRVTTRREDGQAVQVTVPNLIVPRRQT